jgi:hypothetical protein
VCHSERSTGISRSASRRVASKKRRSDNDARRGRRQPSPGTKETPRLRRGEKDQTFECICGSLSSGTRLGTIRFASRSRQRSTTRCGPGAGRASSPASRCGALVQRGGSCGDGLRLSRVRSESFTLDDLLTIAGRGRGREGECLSSPRPISCRCSCLPDPGRGRAATPPRCTRCAGPDSCFRRKRRSQ